MHCSLILHDLGTMCSNFKRDKGRHYMDAMALVRKYGKPDIFLTMTCNPNWDEINRELYPGQTPQDRPDLVVRVFRAKLAEFKDKLLQKYIIGKVKAYVYVVEFQKRGLPHAHFLLIMEGRFLPRIPLCPSDDEMFPLPESVFSHGQLYVQLSISTARKNVNILVIPDAQKKEKNSAESKKKRRPVNTYTKNMVWKEIFTS